MGKYQFNKTCKSDRYKGFKTLCKFINNVNNERSGNMKYILVHVKVNNSQNEKKRNKTVWKTETIITFSPQKLLKLAWL